MERTNFSSFPPLSAQPGARPVPQKSVWTSAAKLPGLPADVADLQSARQRWPAMAEKEQEHFFLTALMIWIDMEEKGIL